MRDRDTYDTEIRGKMISHMYSHTLATLRTRESSYLSKTYTKYYSLVFTVLKHELP